MVQSKLILNNLYEVHSNGEVISQNRKKGKPLKPGTQGAGLKYVILVDTSGKKTYWLVHRLVAEVFIPNPNNYPFVKHLDGNFNNNDVSNLKWFSTTRKGVI